MPTSVECDIAIIGGGPAGAGAAYFLSRQGLNIIVLEAKFYPRIKVCGDGIGPRAVLALREIGLGDWLESGGHHRVERLRITASNGASITSLADPVLCPIVHGFVVSRAVFDQKLVEHAREHGAEVRECWHADSLIYENDRVAGVRGTYKGEPATVRARLTAVADGSKGKISRLFGAELSRPYAVGMRTYARGISGIDECANIYFSRKFPKSYAWIFPTGEDSANIGVGLLDYHNAQAGGGINEVYDFFTGGQDLKPASLQGCVTEGRPVGSVMRMNFGRRIAQRPGLAFLGDAAGLVSPINGEGISHAIESGKLLAESLGGRPTDNAFVDRALIEYEKALRQRFLSYFRWGRIFDRVFGTPDNLDRAVAKAQNDRDLRIVLGGVLANTVHPRELVRVKLIAKMFF